MAVFGKLVLSLFASSYQVAADHPVPPIVTDKQKQLVAAQTSKAQAASNAATPGLLAFFDSKEFRAELNSCCPGTQHLSAKELLERLRAEMNAAELAHSFPASNATGHSSFPIEDMTIAKAAENEFWLNEWHVPLIDNAKIPTLYDQAEVGIFGCQEFKDIEHPTWDEASDRMIYIVQNVRQYDFGSRPNFGDASVIFKKSYVKDNVLISAVDSGLWEMACNKSTQELHSGWGVKLNCSAWQPQQVGTLDYLDHLILANFASWANENNTVAQIAGRFFARTPLAGDYLNLPSTKHSEDEWYLEANILMNPRLPEGVSLIIGDFAALFGTDLGTSLQALAQQRGWPLAWARSSLSTDSRHVSEDTSPGNARILDPKIASVLALNATLQDSSQKEFDKLWATVKLERSSSTPSFDQLKGWWNTLASQQLKIAPVSAFACADPDSCAAVDANSGHCICHSARSTIVV